MNGRRGARRPRGIRRVERWLVGIVMGIMAFVLEKAVLRSVRKGDTTSRVAEPEPRTLTSRGGDVDVE